MKIKYLMTVLFLGYAANCSSTEVINRPENQEYKNKTHKQVIEGREVTPVEQKAVETAFSQGVSQNDIEKGIKNYRKKIDNNPQLDGKSFDIYDQGMISIDNYL